MCRKVMHRKSKGSLRSFSNYAGRSGFTSQPKEKLISSKSTGFFGLGNTCKYKCHVNWKQKMVITTISQTYRATLNICFKESFKKQKLKKGKS